MNNCYTFSIEQKYEKRPTNTEAFDEFLDRVLDEFDSIGVEADYLANLETNSASWTLTVRAEDQLSGLIQATSSLRTALHAAQCGTANWYSMGALEAIISDVQNTDLASA